MTAETSNALHLPDLLIKGFRGFNELRIPQLGRVTLLAGKNGVGKSSVLEAVQVYSSRGSAGTLSTILDRREEYLITFDEDDEMERSSSKTPDPESLFYGRNVLPDSQIVIGSSNGNSDRRLTIKLESPNREQKRLFDNRFYDDLVDLRLLKSKFAGKERILPWVYSPEYGIIVDRNTLRYRRHFERRNGMTMPLECRSVGPGLMTNMDTTKFWSDAWRMGEKSRILENIRSILSIDIEDLGIAETESSTRKFRSLRTEVVLPNYDRPVPLKSLGDGAFRVYCISVALAGLNGGFLVVDEIENGLHHSIQQDFWRIMIKIAYDNNVQIFATTHSEHCAIEFAKAALESENNEGKLVRLDRDGETIIPVLYSDEDLKKASDLGFMFM